MLYFMFSIYVFCFFCNCIYVFSPNKYSAFVLLYQLAQYVSSAFAFTEATLEVSAECTRIALDNSIADTAPTLQSEI